MGKKKRFIDKKKAVSFHLVHRSQRDPLQAADEAPEHVLVPASDPLLPADPEVVTESRQDEQKKYGIFFDDDYDYMQHLRDVSELNEVGPGKFSGQNDYYDDDIDTVSASGSFGAQGPAETQQQPSLQLPSTVFGSTVETDVGMLNKAAPVTGPHVDWDPDVVAALDDDFNYSDPDNVLEDDFMAIANAEVDEEECQRDWQKSDDQFKTDRMNEYFQSQVKVDTYPSDESGDDFGSDQANDSSEVDSLGDMTTFSAEETKSHFTNYSMTSSVIRRNDGLTLLDDRFERLFEEYGDDQVGALDHEDIEGRLQQGSVLLDAALEQFTEAQAETKLKDAVLKAEDLAVASDSESEAEDLVRVAVEEPREKWDCESILSTYSTLYNHPQTISEPKKPKPIRVNQSGKLVETTAKGLTHKEIQQQQQSDMNDRACTYRPKEESADEKRERKKAVKEERKARREEKKNNKLAFKAEQIRQHNELMTVKKNLQGIKIA